MKNKGKHTSSPQTPSTLEAHTFLVFPPYTCYIPQNLQNIELVRTKPFQPIYLMLSGNATNPLSANIRFFPNVFPAICFAN